MTKGSKLAVCAIAFSAIVVASVWLWQSWKVYETARLDSAYEELFTQVPSGISNRYHSKIEAFTDVAEWYRFDGGNQEMVKALVQQFALEPSETQFSSGDSPPSWWTVHANADIYTRGSSNQHVMLIYQPGIGRVFFEQMKD